VAADEGPYARFLFFGKVRSKNDNVAQRARFSGYGSISSLDIGPNLGREKCNDQPEDDG
jgi:hypothetical protein